MTLSSSVRVGGGVSIKIVIVISAIVATIVVVGVGVVGFWGAALLFVVLVFLGTGAFGSSASFGRHFGHFGHFDQIGPVSFVLVA